MLKVKTIIEGKFTWYNERRFTDKWESFAGNIFCPICNSKITLCDKIYWVSNNGKLFPSVLMHKSCIVNDMTMTTRILMEKYSSYRNELNKLNDRNKCWCEN